MLSIRDWELTVTQIMNSLFKFRLKLMKEKNLQPRLLYTARISFKYEGEIKNFSDKQKLREFSTTKPAFQQMLKDLL